MSRCFLLFEKAETLNPNSQVRSPQPDAQDQESYLDSLIADCTDKCPGKDHEWLWATRVDAGVKGYRFSGLGHGLGFRVQTQG